MNLRILFQDEHLVAVDKPARFHVHPPEDGSHGISRNENCLFILRNQTGRYLYPVHRLDRATSGVLVFAFSSEMARELSALFQAGTIEKTYYAVVRGWTDEEGFVDHPLDGKESLTRYERVGCREFPTAVGRYASARYSMMRVRTETGRLHQIRRHFAHLSHPLIGDTIYGDGKHNRFFRESLGIDGLLLKAYSLRFRHPSTGEALRLQSRWAEPWHRVFEAFGLCPFGGME